MTHPADPAPITTKSASITLAIVSPCAAKPTRETRNIPRPPSYAPAARRLHRPEDRAAHGSTATADAARRHRRRIVHPPEWQFPAPNNAPGSDVFVRFGAASPA